MSEILRSINPAMADLLLPARTAARPLSRRREPAPYVDEEEEQSLAGSLRDKSLTMIGAAGNLLDLPGSMARDVISSVAQGKFVNPFDQLLDPFGAENRTTGRDLLRQTGMAGNEDTWGNAIAGFGAEVALDPLTYMTLGGSALGKAGKVASKAGLFDEIGSVASRVNKKQLGQVGNREARLTTTLGDMAKYGSEKASAKASELIKASPELADEAFGGMVGFGLPFMQPMAIAGQGAKSKAVARGMDTAGRAARYAKVPGTEIQPLNSFLNLFDAPGMGTKTPFGHALATEHTRAKDVNRTGMALDANWTAGELEKAGMLDKPSADLIRAAAEGVIPINQLPVTLQPIVKRMRAETAAMPAKAKKEGFQFSELNDDEIDHAARYLIQSRGHHAKRTSMVFDADDPSGTGRLDFLRDAPGGTNPLKEMLSDTRLNDLIDGGADPEKVRLAVEAKAKGWLPDTWRQYKPKHKKADKEGYVHRSAGRYKKIAEWMSKNLSRETRDAGVWGNHPVLDHQARRMAFEDSLTASHTVAKGLSQPQILITPTGAANMSADGSMAVGEVLSSLKLNLGDVNGGMGRKILELRGVAVDDAALESLSKMRLSKTNAEELMSIHKVISGPDAVNDLIQMVDSVTNYSKGMWTSVWPAFHVRNRLSGAFQNMALGIWSKSGDNQASTVLTGKVIKDASQKPWVIAEYQRRLAVDAGTPGQAPGQTPPGQAPGQPGQAPTPGTPPGAGQAPAGATGAGGATSGSNPMLRDDGLAAGQSQAATTGKLPTEIKDTRGSGVQYHGARGEINEIHEGYYNPDNIYGASDTFYTTDAMDIASGYGRKKGSAKVYQVSEKEPVNFFDMEKHLSDDDARAIFGITEKDWSDGLIEEAIENAKGLPGGAGLRNIMDEMRSMSSDYGMSKDTVQEFFDNVSYNLQQKGYGGMTHVGGLKTKRPAHTVKIYLRPTEQIELKDSGWTPSGSNPMLRDDGYRQAIDVDGKQFSAIDSTGAPIHTTEEGVRNFWKGFKDSKLVDEQGRPVPIYHGTRNADLGTTATKERNRRIDQVSASLDEWNATHKQSHSDLSTQRYSAIEAEADAHDQIASLLKSNRAASNATRASSWQSFSESVKADVSPEAWRAVDKGLLKQEFDRLQLAKREAHSTQESLDQIPKKPSSGLATATKGSEAAVFDTMRYGENDTGYLSAGTYFTKNAELSGNYAGAGEGAGVIPVYANLRNPFVHGVTSDPRIDEMVNATVAEMHERIRTAGGSVDDYSRANSLARRKVLEGLGYDGEIYERGVANAAGVARRDLAESEVVVFRPEQVKSATGNRGTFDPSSPNISHMLRDGEGVATAAKTGGVTTAANPADAWHPATFAARSKQHEQFNSTLERLSTEGVLKSEDADILRLAFSGASEDGMGIMNMPHIKGVDKIKDGKAAGQWRWQVSEKTGLMEFDIDIAKNLPASQSSVGVLLHELGHMAQQVLKNQTDIYGGEMGQLISRVQKSGRIEQNFKALHGDKLGEYLAKTYDEQFPQLFADSIMRRKVPQGAVGRIMKDIRDWVVQFLEKLKLAKPLPAPTQKRIDEIIDELLGFDGTKAKATTGPARGTKGTSGSANVIAGTPPGQAVPPAPPAGVPGQPTGQPTNVPPVLDDEYATRIIGEMLAANGVVGKFEGNAVAVAGMANHGQSGDINELLSGVGRPGVQTFSPARTARKAIGMEPGTTFNPIDVRGVGGRTESGFGIAAAGEELGHATEFMNRAGPWITMMDRGHDAAEAAKRVGASQVLYSNKNYTAFEQQVMGRLFPFYKFSRGSMPVVIRHLMEKPGGPYGTVIKGTNRAQDDGNLAPDYVRDTANIPIDPNNPIMSMLAGTPPKGTDRYLTGFGLMHEDALSFGPSVRGAGLEALSRMNPFLKGPLEWATGQTFFQRGPEGGRDLDKLDPTVGRLVANVMGQTEQDDSKKFPLWMEQIVANSPIARATTTARSLTDPRKRSETVPFMPGPASLFNTLSGVRVSDVSPGSKDAILRDMLNAEMKGAGAAVFERIYFSQEQRDKMSPEALESALKLQGLANVLARRAKERKAEKDAAKAKK